ncbi:MAG: glycosyltransferase [Roseibium album]|uniref:glycosyltransferase family 2 protein n=1 Tax=Roseibium album TaxID=311410 RepID=UPI0032EB8AD1
MIRSVPSISVGMPVYNGDQYVADAISAIQNQTFADFELIISDNASTDGTQDVCRRFARTDSRIQYSRNERNLGAAQNYNLVFRKSVGRYFRWANADDVSGRELHARCFDVLERHPDAVLAYGKTQLIDQDGSVMQDYEDNLNLRDQRPSDRYRKFFDVVGLSNVLYGLIRRDALTQTRLMGTGGIPSADILLIAELTLHGKFVEIPQSLFSRRIHRMASSWNPSDDEAQRKFWSASGKGFVLPTWRTGFSEIASVFKAPISASEKAKICRYIVRRMSWARVDLAHELFQLVSLARRSG